MAKRACTLWKNKRNSQRSLKVAMSRYDSIMIIEIDCKTLCGKLFFFDSNNHSYISISLLAIFYIIPIIEQNFWKNFSKIDCI